MDNEARDAGYCPICNPKNYEVWERRIKVERARKAGQREVVARQQEEAARVQERDRSRAAAMAENEVREGRKAALCCIVVLCCFVLFFVVYWIVLGFKQWCVTFVERIVMFLCVHCYLIALL